MTFQGFGFDPEITVMCPECKEQMRWYECYRVHGVGKNTLYEDNYICDNKNCQVFLIHRNQHGKLRGYFGGKKY